MEQKGGQLIKAKIYAYEKDDFKTPIDKMGFELPVNPENFSQSFKLSQDESQGQGSEGTAPSYTRTDPEELKFQFIFDGTGTIEGYKAPGNEESVKDQLKLFMDVAYNMKGETHRPHYLLVLWGQVKFQCQLSNLDLNYTLFEPNGDPLRVKVNATFKKYVSQKERVQREKKKSPDLTHIRLVKAGDRLDWITQKIYNDPKYTMQVAKANGLTTFRKLKVGAEIILPPLDKTEEN
jgi:hypothetical protein